VRRLNAKNALKLTTATLVGAIGLMAFPVTASTQRSDDTAEGTCHMTGVIRFADPVGFEPEQTTFTDYAGATCTGTVNGVFMENERAYLRAAGGGLLSCGANRVTSRGVTTFTRNTRTRSDDVEIDYIAESQGVVGQVASRIRGRVSGEAVASVRFRGEEQALRDCGAGTSGAGSMTRTVGPSPRSSASSQPLSTQAASRSHGTSVRFPLPRVDSAGDAGDDRGGGLLRRPWRRRD
jgi:hypothetical protein